MYIRDAENLAAGFGEVFPELPEELIGGTERSAAGSNERSNEKAAAAETIGTSSGTRVEQRGIEHPLPDDHAFPEGAPLGRSGGSARSKPLRLVADN
jgi:hypothetical protein